jgi:hypothetical protein
VREWFLPRAKEYALKHAFTQTGAIRYTTVGAVVPVRDVSEGVPGVTLVKLKRPAPEQPGAKPGTPAAASETTAPEAPEARSPRRTGT